ncbi:MAG: diacylglycerol/lipid kinase family protein [Candidatus Omnitrophota bacterium]
MKQVAVIYNPGAQVGRALGKIKRVEAGLTTKNIGYDLFLTESEAHMIELAARVVHDYPTIIGAGGDTTINIIAREILKARKGNVLGIISQGSINDLAKGIGVHKLSDSLHAIANRTYRAMDVGAIRCGDQEPYLFLAQASLGLGVVVSRYVDDWMKHHTFARRFHKLAQTTAGLSAMYSAFKTKTVPVNLQLQSAGKLHHIDTSLLVFNNTACFAGIFKPSPTATPLDGQLDCCVFKSSSFGHMVRTALQIKSAKHLEDGKVEIFRDNYFKIFSNQPFEFQIDGEIVRSECEIEVYTIPRALNIMVNAERFPNKTVELTPDDRD